MDVMWLFFHTYSFSEMVIEREVKCYCICAPVVFFGLMYLILMGFGPVLVYFSVHCPAVKALKDH